MTPRMIPRSGACLGLSLVALAMTTTPSAAQSFSDTTSVTVVEVPVQVLVDGRPVRDLTVDDFEILDGRKKQEIVGFERIDLSMVAGESGPAPVSAPAALPVAARRHFLLLFDLSFSDLDSVARAQEAARTLIRERLHPSDLVSVATYSEARGLQMVLSFTPDREQVLYALDTLGLVDPLTTASDPMGLLVAEFEAEAQSGGRFAGLALENARDLQGMSSRDAQNQNRAAVLGLTESIKGLARMLDSVAGRVQVMLLSEGFDSSLLLGTEGTTADERASIQATSEAAMRGEIWAVGDDDRFGSGAALSAMDEMVEELRRADCVIQAIDIGGLRAETDAGSTGRGGSATGRQNSLFIMANETGGELFRNTNDMDVLMTDVLERTSVTYLLAFQPRNLEPDGRFHRLRVKLKNGPRNARLVHRPGYYAPRPFAEQDAMTRRLNMAGLIVGGREGGLLDTAALAVPVATGEASSYVPVLIEIDGETLVGNTRQPALPLEIYAYAIESSGSIRDFFTRGMTLDLEAQGPAIRQRGVKFWGHLYLEPGDYTLRVVVRDGLSGETGVTTTRVAVPDAGEAVYPPLVPEPLGVWVLLRDDLPEGKSPPYPFMAGEEPFVPAARPSLRSGEAAAVCLMGRSWRDDGLALEAELVGPDGTEVGTAPVRLGAADGACLRATVEIPALEPGDYALTARAETASGHEIRAPALPVRIGG